MEETKEDRVEYKIYQIVCIETGEIYFGKTIRTLEERLRCHIKDLDCASKQIILRGDYYIEQINSTFDEEESVRLERYYIETFECVNKNIPGRTVEEYHKEYRETHKEELSKYNKEYRETHKEELSKYNKEYREAHKEEISEYHKEYDKKYYETHKEEILKKKKEKYTCECGSTLSKRHKKRHERTQKHINYINSKK